MRIHVGFSLAAAMTVSVLNAKTVAWWPLAYENGVRTTVDTVLENRENPGTLDAQPISMDGDAIIAGSDTCPVGANAFPTGWGVWDSQTGASVTGATGLYFNRPSNSGTGKGGAVRVSNPEGLCLQTFTFECFFKMAKSAYDSWNVIAVMPGKLATSSGAKVVNYDSWGLRVIGQNKLQFRCTKKTAESTDIENVGEHNVTKEITVGGTQGFAADVNFFDGKWHHVALSVSATSKLVNIYVDYAYVTAVTIPDGGLSYGQEDFFIGATPQALGAFGGTIAHVRISDQSLDTNNFLHLTDLAGEPEDVIFHADFETPDGFAFSSDYSAVNRGRGRTMVTTRVDYRPRLSNHPGDDGALASVNESLTNATARVNKRKLFCEAKARSYGKFIPYETDNFTNGSFTVECFYKTTQSAQYIPLVRRRGGSNVQFNLGFGGTKGRLSAAILEYYAESKTDGAKSLNDTINTNDGKWHHAALVVDALSKRAMLYRDYQAVASSDYNGVLVPHTTPVVIGGVDNVDNAFDGSIDDVRITMRALKPGEFLTGDYFDPTTTTLGWAGYEDTVNSTAGALSVGTTAKATATGNEPTFVAHGRNPKILDGGDPATVLRTDNVKAVELDQGVVKYPDNNLLPLFPEQTVEFMVKSGPQTAYAGLVRCNLYRGSAEIPTWGLSFSGEEGNQAKNLRVRCCVQYDTGLFEAAAINENTPIVLGDGKWHHIAMTIKTFRDTDGVRKTTIMLYKDYSETAVWMKTVNGGLYYGAGNASVWLGASSSTTAFFKGQLDELRISQGILKPSEFLRSAKNGMAILVR